MSDKEKMKTQRLKSDYDDVKVYREGACVFAKGNPQHVRMAVDLAVNRVLKRSRKWLKRNDTTHSGDFASQYLELSNQDS